MINELKLYTQEEILWQTRAGITNSGGHLALHLIGNLNHWIGALIAKNGYQRDRNHEFNGKPVPVSVLIKETEHVQHLIKKELPKIESSKLKGPFPGPIPYEMNMEEFLLHVYAHFSYHLGQLNYHRRMLDQ